jgi:hypothetical protein
MKINVFKVLFIGLLFGNISGSDQASMPVYPANVPAPTAEPMVRQPSARTKEYKRAYKRPSPYLYQGSWLQNQSQRAGNWLTGAPTTRAIEYDKVYPSADASKPQQQTEQRGAATFRAYANAFQRDRDIAARENNKAYAAARNYEARIKSIDSDMKVNRREKRELGSWPTEAPLRKELDDQYRTLSTQKAMLQKEEDKQWANARYWNDEYSSNLLKGYSTLMSGLEYLGR